MALSDVIRNHLRFHTQAAPENFWKVEEYPLSWVLRSLFQLCLHGVWYAPSSWAHPGLGLCRLRLRVELSL